MIIQAVPRRKYYSDENEGTLCPECNLSMIEHDCTVVLWVTNKLNKVEFITNLEETQFCEKCPVVVFSTKSVEQAAIVELMDDVDFYYNILGIVNLELIPEEKKYLQLGNDENPITLVEFLPELNNSVGKF